MADPDMVGEVGMENENTVLLSGILAKPRSKAIYTYDFGDEWEHSIVIEKRLPADPNLTYPVCTGGQLACPPEDCGGLWGFYGLLEILSDPAHPRHEQMLNWSGEFDNQAFSVDEVNRRLNPMPRRAQWT